MSAEQNSGLNSAPQPEQRRSKRYLAPTDALVRYGIMLDVFQSRTMLQGPGPELEQKIEAAKHIHFPDVELGLVEDPPQSA